MATLAGDVADHMGAQRAAPAQRRPRVDGRSVFSRVRRALREARRRARERDIADFVARSGGRLTDSVERELMDRHLRAGTSGLF